MDISNVTLGDANLSDARILEDVLNNTLNYTSVQIESAILPQWIIHFYFVFIFFGSLVNFIYTAALLRCKRNGTLTIVLQLSFVDGVLSYVTYTEILTIQRRSWEFSTENCQFFNGMEILTNSLIIYMVVCINFHIISLWNLHKFEISRESKNPLTSCRDSSDECLVTRNENSHKPQNIDYSKRRNDVSVIFPSIFIWFICISLSIPSFTLSSILHVDDKVTLCGIVDSFYGQIMQKLLIVFKIAVPLPLLIFSLAILIVKLFKTSPNRINNVLTKKFDEIKLVLIFCILLSICFILTSFQRQFFYMYHHYHISNLVPSLEVPPLFNNQVHSRISIYSSMLHYTGSSIRGSLYFYMLPKFRNILKKKILICYKSNK